MPGFEILGLNAVELIITVYFIAGSYSIGYLLLRTGWPKFRILEENYRIGWSIIFGFFFTILCIIMAVLFSMQKIFPIVIVITFITVLIILSLRRMFFASKSITVSMPKEHATAKIIAEKTSKELLSDKQFILNKSISIEQFEKIKESLQKLKASKSNQENEA